MPDQKNPAGRFLVTGASSGIGAAITNQLLDAGYSVVALGRRAPAPSDQPGSDRLQHIGIDLSDLDAIDRRSSEIRQFGTLDGAVFCHGYGDFGGLEQFSADRIRRLVDTNLTSVILLARLVLPLFKRQATSSLIIVGSEAALRGGKQGAVYSASKFGLRGLAQSLREESSGSGVRVCIVNPGMVNSPFFDNLHFAPGPDRENALDPEDVANAVMSVISAPSHMVTEEINLSPLKKVVRQRD